MHIYKFTFPGGETYVGMTIRDTLVRFEEHCSFMRKGIHHSYKVQKAYTLYNTLPTLTLIETCKSLDELKLSEIKHIEKLDTFNNGLNCTRGGDHTYEGKLSQDDYKAIVTFLAVTDLTAKEVAEELDVPYSIVNNISSGYTHNYLKEQIPEEYSTMISKVGTRTKKVHSTTVYHNILLDLVFTLDTYKVISARHNVNATIVAGISGGYKHRYLENEFPEVYSKLALLRGNRVHGIIPSKEYCVLSPKNEKHCFVNISEFARVHNLDIGALNKLVNGKAKSTKGWTRFSE